MSEFLVKCGLVSAPSSPYRNHSLLFFNFSTHLNPLSQRPCVGLHRLVSHLVQLVPHLGCPPPHFAGRYKGAGLGWLGYPILRLKLLLRQTEGVLYLDVTKLY